MKKNLFLLLTLIGLSVASVKAQVLIGGNGTTDTPHEGAILDLSKTTGKGLLLPKVNLGGLTDFSVADESLQSDGKGMMVYNTNDALPGGKGLYVWDGAKWNKTTTGCTTAPTVSVSKASYTVFQNSAAPQLSFTTGLNGGSYTYQWKSATAADGTYYNIPDATNETYATPTNAVGTLYYQCEVSNPCGTTISATYTVTVQTYNEGDYAVPDNTYRPQISGVGCFDVREGYSVPGIQSYSVNDYGNQTIRNISWIVEPSSGALLDGQSVSGTLNDTETLTFTDVETLRASAATNAQTILLKAIVEYTDDHVVRVMKTVTVKNASCCATTTVRAGVYIVPETLPAMVDWILEPGETRDGITRTTTDLCIAATNKSATTIAAARAACAAMTDENESWRMPNIMEILYGFGWALKGATPSGGLGSSTLHTGSRYWELGGYVDARTYNSKTWGAGDAISTTRCVRNM